MYFSVVALVLTKALVTEVCHTLNVTVAPGPVVMVPDKDNLTLSCLVSQKKRSSSVLILRWFFSPLAAPTRTPPPSPASPSPSPSPSPALQPAQFLIVKLGVKKTRLYGNYTHRFPQPKFRLYEETEGEVYRLRIVNVTRTDQGFYTCRVQEIRRHRNTWRALSNGTSTTQLTVPLTLADGTSEGLWRLFADVYLCAVLMSSLGLLSILLFTLVLICQYIQRRHRLKASYLLVKCPESSSGETVTSSSSSSGSSPRAQRKATRQKTDRGGETETPPKLPNKPLPHIPAKAPVAAKRPQKPRRLKTHPRGSAPSRVSKEESLTYAELELVRPRPEPPASSTPDATTTSPDTVYAQILFQEKQL